MSSVIPYITKEVSFEFRGRRYEFALSHGLFSSAGIDRGSRFLLRVFSGLLDGGLFPAPGKLRQGGTLSVLDAGCGCGVLGICAGTALRDLAGKGAAGERCSGPGPGLASVLVPASASVPALAVRAQDRDELARLFTEYNGLRNGLAGSELEARTEALLAGPAGAAWDLILSNVPAKAGRPVLEDFIGRSAGMLKSGGLALVVVVNPLAPWFRDSITARGFALSCEEAGKDHTVFAYGRGSEAVSAGGAEAGVFPGGAAYCRGGGDFEMEGVRYRIDAIYGAAGFDRAGAAVVAAVRLAGRLGEKIQACLAASPAVLVHEPDQGHFPVWFSRRFPFSFPSAPAPGSFVLSGRNILSLEASRRNLEKAAGGGAVSVKIMPAVDIALSREELALPGGYGVIALFPEFVPMTDRIAAYWEGLAALLAENGIALIGLNASASEKFDRAKSAAFTRLGDFRRSGFRALAYRKNAANR